MNDVGKLSDGLMKDVGTDIHPIQYSRDYLKSLDEKRLSLPSLATYVKVIGKKGAVSAVKQTATREGTWYFGSLAANGRQPLHLTSCNYLRYDKRSINSIPALEMLCA